MKKKYADSQKKIKKSTLPDMGTYNGFPNDFDTFAKKLFNKPKKDVQSNQKSKFWGSSERFFDPKKAKVKRIPVPGPGMYNMIAAWSGKTTARDKK